MSGPGLKHVDSHSAIHEAALIEAEELNVIIENLLKANEMEKALEAAFIAVEHWETRTLRHAASEEEGLYKELVEESPELKESVVALTRDHNILRHLVKEIKEILETGTVDDEVLQRFQALVLVDLYHNMEEEKVLPNH